MNCIRYFYKIYFNPTLNSDYNEYYYAVAPDVEKQTTTVEYNIQFLYDLRKIHS